MRPGSSCVSPGIVLLRTLYLCLVDPQTLVVGSFLSEDAAQNATPHCAGAVFPGCTLSLQLSPLGLLGHQPDCSWWSLVVLVKQIQTNYYTILIWF